MPNVVVLSGKTASADSNERSMKPRSNALCRKVKIWFPAAKSFAKEDS